MVPTGGSRGGPAPEEQLGQIFFRLNRGWMKMGREEARELGLSLPQMFLVGGLREMGEIPVNRWVEMMGASPSATTGLLDGLESGGYIQRAHDAKDRRQVLISLTPKGRALADRVRAEYQLRWKGYCSGISGAELEAAARTLGRILERMGSHPALGERATEPLHRSKGRAQ